MCVEFSPGYVWALDDEYGTKTVERPLKASLNFNFADGSGNQPCDVQELPQCRIQCYNK